MKKIAVFDLDGTLAHTAPTLAAGMNIFLRESGREEIPYELMEAFLGNGARVLLNNVYEYLGLPREKKDIDEALEGFFVSYGQTFLDAELYDGIEDTVRMLTDGGVSVGVLSNKPDRFVLPLVKKLFPDIPIAFAVGQTDRPRKPDPTVLLELIAKAGSDVEHCVYIGDSDVDIKTAKNARVTSCAVTWGYRPRDLLTELSPDLIADTPKELYDILKNFIQK